MAHQAAALRITLSLVAAAFLLREWPDSRVLYGDKSPWSSELLQRRLSETHLFTILAWSDQYWWFEVVYAATIIVCILLLVGWHTRTMSWLFMLLIISLQNRNPLIGDGGDNITHLLAIYLAFTRCGRVWSLDARRAKRSTGPDTCAAPQSPDVSGIVLWLSLGLLLAGAQLSGRSGSMISTGGFSVWAPVPGWATLLWGAWASAGIWFVAQRRPTWHEARLLFANLANMLHNCAVFVIVGQICLVYLAAGWYKLLGSAWRTGTAVYFPLHVDYFSPWPEISHVLAESHPLMVVITYGTVATQTAFPFFVFNRRIKNILLVIVMIEHLAIGMLLALPFFSLAMLAADTVFIPSSFLCRLSGATRRMLIHRSAKTGPGGWGPCS